MGDIYTRPFSKNYSGLINQSVIALGITVLCVTSQELMKRKRRGDKQAPEGLGSRESWEFGYIFQGRCWAKDPSPPSPQGWPLSWVKQIVWFPEEKMNKLRGVDATLYVRFLRGCFWFSLLHTFTTFPILFPIHVEFSDNSVSPKSMTRASISSLVLTSHGLSLLWIHICLLFWVTLSWMATLLWISVGAFRLRAQKIEAARQRIASGEPPSISYPHPHPQYGFLEVPPLQGDPANEGLRLRTVMVTNVPPPLRNEKELKEYFEYYMSRKIDKPSVGLNSSTQPGFLNKIVSFLFNRVKRLPAHLPHNPLSPSSSTGSATEGDTEEGPNIEEIPEIERVVIVRKMTELASLLERREEYLRLLETAHIKLARKVLLAVGDAMDRKAANKPFARTPSRAITVAQQRKSIVGDVEIGDLNKELNMDGDQNMDHLISVLGPFVEEFGLRGDKGSMRFRRAISATSKKTFMKLIPHGSDDSGDEVPSLTPSSGYPPPSSAETRVEPPLGKTVWDVLLSLPRVYLDPYQPLVNLSHLFRGKTVPSIDYYTTKVNYLTALITESRAKATSDYDAVSTAFVTFAGPADARKACKYLAVHPNNPLACWVTMAPQYQDLDWIRVMKSSFNAEFVKDWVVSLGVWGFTIFWIFPVSLLVGLVSIQNISIFWPGLKSYLDKHPWEEEIIQSFLPTLLVALLALLIPLILLFIAKKAHTMTTLSALHDRIMTRYYKFLIVNVLVFFCVGTAALQSFLLSFRATTRPDVLKIVADSFPTAGPFYVGWLIFTSAMHAGFELAMFGLALIVYPSTKNQVTPRKRTVGLRPRTLNFYYWLPNHLLVIHVLLLFTVLNPVVIPFATVYFFFETGVIKNQLIHVYAKHYEFNGQVLLIRIVRYSLDGLMLCQAVFLAYMVVLKKTVNVGLAACLIIITAFVKLLMTRICRAQFEHDDIAEAEVLCKVEGVDSAQDNAETTTTSDNGSQDATALIQENRPSFFSLKFPKWANAAYNTVRQRPPRPLRRKPIPFQSQSSDQPFKRLKSVSHGHGDRGRRSTNSRTRAFVNGTTAPDTASIVHHETLPRKASTDPSVAVKPHPPPDPWDDETTCDLPYDNPFYSRSISNELWLPRNPVGILDLDDTVDFRTSLTVVPTPHQLGMWFGIPETASPRPMSIDLAPDVHEPSTEDQSPSTPATSCVLTGSEDIDLPAIIAQRVQAGEGDIDRAPPSRRPTSPRRKVSGEGAASSMRRPSILSIQPQSGYRSFSAGSTTQQRPRSNSILSGFGSTLPLDRSRSAEETGLRPGIHAQVDFVADVSGSHLSLAPPQLTRARNISTHEAVVYEVIAEEEQAMASRLEEEQAEAEKATTKSWLTSWMFKKIT
ncbi:hypothetical protein PC9H_010557 [Pleurotus ostreatus]|uniref:DUF221-domain-containing protein n=1 Tax=Pleurotus ostreatus TaxID=5322 RepID=A0A8H6ZMP6_PLEOS|nr:uncharacterized protein PC9H_010557 [Pleurotus ostreatus]KAF7422401.1 hypothetical protein PC9H_010557 [Pleurotus ostreatus]KAJ8691766.1 hypothetical protein PTI98_011301 [Pleurotus ostreatus]